MMQFITVILLFILVGSEVDLFVPSFPELQEVFCLSPFMVELTLGVNLMAHCLSALVIGNLGDRYGRKPVLLISLGVFLVGSILCVGAGAFWVLLMGRFLQGIGISGPAVLGYLIIADAYPIEQQQKLMGVMNGICTLGMACAPVVGSYVNLYCHWQGNFWVLLILAVICLVMVFINVPKGGRDSEVKLSLSSYLPILKSKRVYLFMLTITCLTIPYWVFIGISPILYMQDLAVPLEKFGFYQGAIAAVFSIVSLSSGWFIKKFGQRNVLGMSAGLVVAFLILDALLLIFKISHPAVITLSILVLSVGVVGPVNVLWPLSLEAIPGAKSRIAAIMVASRLIFTSLGCQVVGYFYNKNFTCLGIFMGSVLVVFLVAFYRLYLADPKSFSSQEQKLPIAS